ncbi:monovalent cation/H+ antiporter complex subunit F [Actinopolymorpha sp. NPDC004070]|uniref:monovalent cation/H+ antiporter complex subunit F n=1 Tax=Actinopolymorpha sp. NPDC004070 TaxID=3154548 RepID=UPI0033AB759B
MTDIFWIAAVAEIVIAVPLLARLGRGPTVADRIVAVNTVATQATLAVVFAAAATQRPIYLDVALWLAAFSYLGTIVWARYLERGLL